MEDSKKILKLQKNKNFFPFIALNRRYYSSVLSAKKIITKDNSSRIIQIHDQENTLLAKKLGKPLKVVKNWMFANSIHLIDFAYQFGRGEIINIQKTKKINIFKDGTFNTVIYFDSGDVVYYNFFWNRPAPWCVQISTRNFFIELKPLENMSYISKDSRKWRSTKISNFDKIYKPGIYLMLKNILKNKNNLNDLIYSHKLMNLINRIYFD